MRGLSAEQMLLIADEVCAAHGVRVRDFPVTLDKLLTYGPDASVAQVVDIVDYSL